MAIHNSSSTRPSHQVNWNVIVAAAKNGICAGINYEWINTARLEGGAVNAGVGVLSAPLLKSDSTKVQVSRMIRTVIEPDATTEAGAVVGPEIARAIAREFADAWYDWADHFNYGLNHNVYFPAFVAFAGPQTPRMPGLPSALLPITSDERVYKWLSGGQSSGDARLSAGTLGPRLRAALEAAGAMALGTSPGSAASSGPLMPGNLQQMAMVPQRIAGSAGAHFAAYRKRSIGRRATVFVPVSTTGNGSPRSLADDLAAWVSASFTHWKGTMRTGEIMGAGPIPTFAPPYVPAGPVVGGTLYGSFDLCSEFGAP